MKEFQDLTPIVSIVMDQSSEAKRDDTALYIMVCERMNPEAVKRPFAEVMKHRKDYGLPKFESVSRVRRRLQAKGLYRPDEAVIDGRFEKFKEVREWALSE